MELKTTWTTDHKNPATDGQHTASSELIEGENFFDFAERHLNLIGALNEIILVRNPGPLPGDPPVVAAGPGIDLHAAEKISSLKRERSEREAASATETADDPPVKVEAQPVGGESKPVGLRSRRRRLKSEPEGLVANPRRRRRETSEPEVSE